MKYLIISFLLSLFSWSAFSQVPMTTIFTAEADTLAVQNNPYSCHLSVLNTSLTFTCTLKPDWLNFTDLGGGTIALEGNPTSPAAKTPVTILASDGSTYTYDLKVQQQVSQVEFEALKDLYKSTNGNNWTEKWDISQNNVSSKWKGLTVTDDGRISRIVLLSNNLQGFLPASIGNLSNLIDLDLSRNSLTGTIPKEIGNISNLETLNLFINQLSGEIPSEIGNLSSLIALNLQENQLSGQIPTALSQLSKLEQLILSQNQFTGEMPSALTLLSKLKIFSVSDNSLSSLPDFSKITSLIKLKVKGNQFFFKDLESNFPLLANTSNCEYKPQDILTFEVGTSEKIIFNEGETLIFSTNLAGVNNRYQWFKQETAVAVTAKSSSSDFFKPACTEADAGWYYCDVTNTKVTGLTYTSSGIEAVYNHYPVFETAAINSAIEDVLYSYNITLSDVDAGNILTINCLNKPTWLSFANLGNGKAILYGTPSNSEVGSFNVVLQAKDGVLKTNFPLQSFTISVANVNDTPSSISLSNNTIGELSIINSYVGSLSTQDVDTGDSFTYSIVGGDGVGTFLIRDNRLLTSQKLSYKTKNTYTLRIKSTDKGGLSVEKDFVIYVIDDNNSPSNLQVYPLQIAENTPVGEVVATLSAYDEDDISLTYSFLKGNGKNDADNTKFLISGNKLIVSDLLDYEKQKYASISLLVSDNRGGLASEIFSFEILNVNDNAPIFLNSPYTFSVDENTTNFSPNLLTVNVFDPDNLGNISYDIPDFPSMFIFNPKTGELSVSPYNSFDYEKQSVYENVLIVFDGTFSSRTTIRLYVNDVNESPSFSKVSDYTVLETTRKNSILISGINDGDSGRQLLQFSAISSNSALLSNLSIEYTQGQSTATLYFDIQGFTGGITSINLTVKDNGSGSNFYTQTFNVTVQNVNDAPTISIPQTRYSFYEDESLLISSVLIADKDVQDNLMTVQLTVQNGGLYLKQISGLQMITGYGSGDATMSFKGTLSDINAALSQLTYQRRSSFVGIDHLIIYVSDNGFTGLGGEKTATVSVSIIVNAVSLPVISVQPATQHLCSDGITTFNVDAFGRNLKYQWKKDGEILAGETAKTLIINKASAVEGAIYSCLVSNYAGQVESNSAQIYVRELSMNTSLEDVKCYGEYKGKITMSSNNGYGSYSYYLNQNRVSATTSNLGAGSYLAQIIDSQGCSFETTLTIEQPQKLTIQNLAIQNTTCQGIASGEITVTATGGMGNYNYQLYQNNVLVKSLYNNTLTGLSSGKYVLKVSDENFCSLSQNLEIQQVPALQIQLLVREASCKNSNDAQLSVVFSGGTAPYSLMWTNYLETHTIAILNEGTIPLVSDLGRFWVGNYRLEISDKNACSATLSQKLEEPASLNLSVLSISKEFCSGTHSGAMWVYSAENCWYSLNGTDYQDNGYFSKLNAGTYTLTVKNQNACTDNFEVVVGAVHPKVNLDFDLQYVSALGAVKLSNTSTNVDSCQWTFGDGISSQWLKWEYEWSPVHVYAKKGTYQAKLKGSNFCGVDSISKSIFIAVDGISENVYSMAIYPNPTSSTLIISLETALHESVHLRLYSNLGFVLYSGTSQLDSNRINFDLSRYPNGLYWIEIESKTGIFRGKVVKIK